jgi:DNA-binding NarL/FixJ family response regulator
VERIRLILVDDHPIFLEGLTTLVQLEYPEIEVVGSFSDACSAIRNARELNPDIVLMDIRMPGMDGVEATRRLRDRMPDIKIVVLTTFKDIDLIQSALAAGVKGYILKETPVAAVIENIKSVHHGNVLLPDEFARQVAWEDQERRLVDAGRLPASSELPAEAQAMTAREQEILALMLRSYSNTMIAETLFISERTVRNYVSRVYEAIGVHDRAGLLMWAIENHLK